MDLLIKVYFPSADFPLGGKMIQHIGNLKICETLDLTGPKGRLEYKGSGPQRKWTTQVVTSRLMASIKVIPQGKVT